MCSNFINCKNTHTHEFNTHTEYRKEETSEKKIIAKQTEIYIEARSHSAVEQAH